MIAAVRERPARVCGDLAPAARLGALSKTLRHGILCAVPLDSRGRPLIGRADALETIAVAARRRPGPNVAVLTGEAGIGKSRLLEHLVDQYRADGLPALFGGCVEVEWRPGALCTDRRGAAPTAP